MKVGKRKKTGELEFFWGIWDEREHKCGVCGERLHFFVISYFAHILSKGSHPALRLDKENIEILCFPHHWKFDHETNRAAEDERFDYLFKKKNKLKLKAHGKTGT